MPDNEFLLRVRTVFESAGVSTIVQQAQAALAQLNQIRSPQERVATAQGIRTAAEERIAGLRRQALIAAGNPAAGSPQYAAVVAEFSKLRTRLTQAFKEIESGTIDIAKLGATLKGTTGTVSRKMREDILATARAFNALPGATRRVVGEAARSGRTFLDTQSYRRILDTARSPAEVAAGVPAGGRRRVDARQLAADEADIAATLDDARAKAIHAARVQQAIASDDQYINATAQAAQARRSQAARARAAELGVGGPGFTDDDLRARSAVQEKINADLAAARVARLRTSQESGLGQQAAAAQRERIAAERQLAAVEHAAARQEVRAAIARQEGTRFQRLQARFNYRGPSRLPEDYQTGGQFLGARALTTVGFAAAGTALYGTVRLVGEMIRESEELNRVLNQVEAQLTSLGPSAAESFGIAREGILSISRETGAQADEIASVFFQFRGAFADSGVGIIDTNEALRQTDQAMKVVAVTGLSLKEVLDSLTAVAKTFGTDIDDIADVALGLQERFGVLARETITFTADLAPVANQIGLTLEDVAALGAVAQQVSGRSGTALAEGFGRILPQLQDLRSEILQIYNLPQLQDQRQGILEAFATGETGEVFKRLIRDYDSLSRSQQNYVIDLLGGRREAQVLIPVLQNASKVTAEWDRNLTGLGEDAGKTDQYFEKFRETIKNTGDRLREVFNQIGEGLFRAGLADAIVGITNALTVLVNIGRVATTIFGAFNETMGGIPARLLTFVAVLKLLQAAYRFATRSTQESATANTVQAVSQRSVAVAATTAAASVNIAGAADVREGLQSLQNATYNNIQTASLRAQRTTRFAPGGPVAGAPGYVPRHLAGGGDAAATASRASRFGGFLRSTVAPLLAFEALNQFFTSMGEQAQRASEVAESTRAKLAAATELDIAAGGDGTENLDRQIAELETKAARLQASAGKVFGTGDRQNPIARAVNFIGGTLTGNETAVRDASGQPQDAEIIQEEITKLRAEQYGKAITALLAADAEVIAGLDTGNLLGNALRQGPFLTALQNAGAADIFNKVVQANPDYSEDIIKIFSSSGQADMLGAAEAAAGQLIQRHEITAENIGRLIELANAGDVAAAELLRLAYDYIQNTPELLELVGKETEKAAREAAGGQGGLSLQTLENARASFEAGATTVGEYFKRVLQEQQGVLDAINTAKRLGEDINPKDLVAIAKINKEISDLIAQERQAQISAVETMASLQAGNINKYGGGAAGEQAFLSVKISQLEAFLGDTRIDTATRFEQVPELISALQDRFQSQLDAIEDPARRLQEARKGFKIPPVLQRLFVEGQAQNDIRVSGYINQIAQITGQGLEQFFGQLADGIVNTALSTQDVLLGILDDQLRRLSAQLLKTLLKNPLASAGVLKSLVGLKQLRDSVAADQGIGEFGELGGTGYAPGDYTREAQEAADKAAEDAAAAAADLARARLEFESIRVSRDPVRTAQIAVQQANLAIAQAETAADRIRGEGQLLQAQRDLSDALTDIVFAQIEQAEAVAEAAGDSVEAATQRLKTANVRLWEVMSDPGSGEAERVRAQTGQLQAQAGVRDATFRDQLGDIDFLLEIEKITTQQAISMLEAMLRIPENTEEMRRELIRKINGLKDDLGRDYQFNLPDQIDLPTLYEVRRLNQTPSGQGYNDNRVININFTANNTADATAIANQIVSQFSRPTRFGTARGMY